MIPVCDARKENFFEILKDVLKWCAFYWRSFWERSMYFARLVLGKHRITVGRGEVLCDPIDERVTVLPKGFGVHVAEKMVVRAIVIRHGVPWVRRLVASADVIECEFSQCRATQTDRFSLCQCGIDGVAVLFDAFD